MNLFDKCQCKGYYKKVRDGIWIHLDKDELKAYQMNSALCGEAIEKEDIECAEKTYFEHRNCNFGGVIVGFVDLVVKGYLDVNYEDSIDVGIGVIPEKFYVTKRPKEVVKCAIVYYANNKKHFVPIEDISEKQ